MAFEFQYKILRSGEILNRLRMSVDLTRAAQEASLLDNENLTDNMLAASTVGTEAYHVFKTGTFSSYTGGSTPAYGVGTASNPNFEAGFPGNYANPSIVATNIYTIDSNGVWNTILSRSVTTDDSVLRICAYLNYLLDVYSSAVSEIYNPGVQFGIAVDGQVIYYPGAADATRRSYVPVRADTQRDATHMEPGPATPMIRGTVAGLGYIVSPVEMTTFCAVSAGSHTVDLVVRILRPADVSDTNLRKMYVYDRSLVTQELPQDPSVVTTAAGVSVAEIPTETVASATEILTNRTTPIVTALNAIGPGALRRKSASHRVLPAVLLDADEESIANLNSALYITCPYQGYASTTLAGSDVANGWRLLRDGTNNLRTDVNHPSAWAVNGVPCLIEVFASIGLQDLRADAASTPRTDILGAFVLGYSTDGTNLTLIPNTHAWINDSRQNVGASTFGTNIKTSVSIRGWLDFRTTPPASNISWFGAYASVIYTVGSGVTTARLRWRCANLNVRVWRY